MEGRFESENNFQIREISHPKPPNQTPIKPQSNPNETPMKPQSNPNQTPTINNLIGKQITIRIQ